MREPILPYKILKYFLDICLGLRYTHNKEVIHRDLKPENLFYDLKNDRIMIGDFGIASFKNSKLTNKGDRLANFNYRAPEQLLKSKKPITKATDIYSLGLVLNEMFTKKLLGGSNYSKITDVNIIYSIFDDLIDKMTINDISERISKINEIIRLVRLYKETIDLEFQNVRKDN